jgi:MarR family transcriptional regulator, transcriptional regulator for hemolysin
MEKLSSTIFFQLDRAIKSYRQYAQKKLNEKGYSITIDQWLVLKTITDQPDISQNEIAEFIFKDKASVTRIIDLLITKGYLHRETSAVNRRRVDLTITHEGKQLIREILPTIKAYRKGALINVEEAELTSIHKTLEKIIKNCSK